MAVNARSPSVLRRSSPDLRPRRFCIGVPAGLRRQLKRLTHFLLKTRIFRQPACLGQSGLRVQVAAICVVDYFGYARDDQGSERRRIRELHWTVGQFGGFERIVFDTSALLPVRCEGWTSAGMISRG